MSNELEPAPLAEADPTNWVDRHGDYLYRYAVYRLGNTEAAADLVQETFLAALDGRDAFAGRATVRTWLTAILKRKIVDHVRRRACEERAAATLSTTDVLDQLFDRKGRWRKQPAKCDDDPAVALERKEFWQTMHGCVGKLPERLKAAFLLREMDGLTGDEVREVLGVTAGNLWTMLHRARLSLGRCLDVNWFKSVPEERT